MGSILSIRRSRIYWLAYCLCELIDAGKDVVVVDNLETGFRASGSSQSEVFMKEIFVTELLLTLYLIKKI